jgi:hypothetical protein
VWPYTTLLKTNIIAGYLNQTNKWNEYSHVFFIDADLAVCDRYDFFNHEFLLVKSYWNNKTGAGFFFGGKTEYFKQLALPFYDEIKFIYENKLPVPKEMDEFYIHLFWERYKDNIHLLETKKDSNFSFFYDNEDLDEVIRRNGNRIFLFPLKSKGRANSIILKNYNKEPLECTVNIDQGYIFNNYTYDFGRLQRIDKSFYRIFWSECPETREVLNMDTFEILNR